MQENRGCGRMVAKWLWEELRCNTALGMVDDNISTLTKMIDYLKVGQK
jgi:hypothetical protein